MIKNEMPNIIKELYKCIIDVIKEDSNASIKSCLISAFKCAFNFKRKKTRENDLNNHKWHITKKY